MVPGGPGQIFLDPAEPPGELVHLALLSIGTSVCTNCNPELPLNELFLKVTRMPNFTATKNQDCVEIFAHKYGSIPVPVFMFLSLLSLMGRQIGLMAKLGEIAGFTLNNAMFLVECSLTWIMEKFLGIPEPIPAVAIRPLALFPVTDYTLYLHVIR